MTELVTFIYSMNTHRLERIVSGGQTGVDQLGLEVAHALGIQTGGVAPKGFLTEDGPNSLLPVRYGLTEHESAEYPSRTKSNVQQSDGTVVFGKVTGGTRLTVTSCINAGKLHIINPTADELRTWLIEHEIKVLNVAGNRGSNLTGEQLQYYRTILYDALTGTKRLAILFQEEPLQWGGRGDPYLWKELKQTGQTLLLPESTADLKDLLLLLISNLTATKLSTGKMLKVDRFQYGGMSSGMISSDYWLQEAIPQLCRKLNSLQEGTL